MTGTVENIQFSFSNFKIIKLSPVFIEEISSVYLIFVFAYFPSLITLYIVNDYVYYYWFKENSHCPKFCQLCFKFQHQLINLSLIIYFYVLLYKKSQLLGSQCVTFLITNHVNSEYIYFFICSQSIYKYYSIFIIVYVRQKSQFCQDANKKAPILFKVSCYFLSLGTLNKNGAVNSNYFDHTLHLVG